MLNYTHALPEMEEGEKNKIFATGFPTFPSCEQERRDEKETSLLRPAPSPPGVESTPGYIRYVRYIQYSTFVCLAFLYFLPRFRRSSQGCRANARSTAAAVATAVAAAVVAAPDLIFSLSATPSPDPSDPLHRSPWQMQSSKGGSSPGSWVQPWRVP